MIPTQISLRFMGLWFVGSARADTVDLAESAGVDAKCLEAELPEHYDATVHGAFLMNHVALSTTFSPTHGPVPHEPGRGAIGLSLAYVPALSCTERFAEYNGAWKTEDTNKTPVAPRISASFALPAVIPWGEFRVVPYAGLAFLPALPMALRGTYSLMASAELGVGHSRYLELPRGEAANLETGLRAHFTVTRIVGDTALKVTEGADDYDDVFVGSTLGVDAMLGMKVVDREDLQLTPYVAGGVVDASTYYWIGDDGVVVVNRYPYFGPAASLGLDALLADRWRIGGELYAAPGGYSRPDPSVDEVSPRGQAGHITTARLRLAFEPRVRDWRD